MDNVWRNAKLLIAKLTDLHVELNVKKTSLL